MIEVEVEPLYSESQMDVAVCKALIMGRNILFFQTDQSRFSARLEKELMHPCGPDSIELSLSLSLSLHNVSLPDQFVSHRIAPHSLS